MLSELTHIQEMAEQLDKISADPYILPPSSEQVIQDLKGSDGLWSFQTPPSSPSSLGSRKSSMCSISSLNSSSSGSNKSQSSPNHFWQRSTSQVRLKNFFESEAFVVFIEFSASIINFMIIIRIFVFIIF